MLSHSRFLAHSILAAALALSVAACIPTPPPLPEPPPDALPKGFPISDYREAAQQGERVLRVDATQSLAQAYVYRAGALAAKGHNHVIAAREMDGYVIVEDDGALVRGDLFFPVLGLTVDEPGLRDTAGEGFESVPKPEDIDGTRRNMAGPDTLNAGAYPFIRVALAPSGDDEVRAVITIRETVREFAIPLTIERDTSVTRARGELVVRQTDFGIQPFSILGGAIRVADEVTVLFDIVVTAGGSDAEAPR